MRRRGMVLALAFLVMPILELAILIRVGQSIGVGWTLALLVADALFGSWLVRREGRRAWQALTTALADRRMPQQELADAALILVGGTLLLTPGFITDFVGLFCILPFTRPLARRALAGTIGSRLEVSFQAHQPRKSTSPSTVVEGEVVDPGD